MNNIKYVINEEKRKIICIITETKDMFHDFADRRLNFDLECDAVCINNWRHRLYEQTTMPNKFIGIATCSPNDEWDVNKGKLLALSRAKDKMNQCFFQRGIKYVNIIDELLDKTVQCLNQYGEKLERSTAKRHAQLEKELGVDNENEKL